MEIIFSIVVLGAPVWIPAVLLPFPPRFALCLFPLSLVTCACALFFASRHAADRDPWQWPSAFISLGALWLTFSLGLGVVATQFARARANRRIQDGSADPPTRRMDDSDPETWSAR